MVLMEKLPKAVRSIIAGAALIGGVVATEAPTEAAQPEARYEQRESFDAERETRAFIEEIASLDADIDDARGRHKLQAIIEERLNVFALALEKHIPYFSNRGSSSVSGSVTPSARETARQRLLSKVSAHGYDTANPALKMLRKIVSPNSIKESLSPEARRRAEQMGF